MRRSLTNAKVPEAVPIGWYRGTIDQMIITHAKETAKNPGTPYFKEVFKISEGEHQEKVVFQNWMIDEKVGGSHKTKRMLQDLNQDPDDFDDDEVCEQLAGLDCWAKVGRQKRKDEGDRETWGEWQNMIAAHSLVDPEEPKKEQAEQAEEAEPQMAAEEEVQEEEAPAPVKPAKPAQRPQVQARPARAATQANNNANVRRPLPKQPGREVR